MLVRSLLRRFAHLVREVDGRGFAGDFRALPHVQSASTQARVRQAVRAKSNVLFCGQHGTGKLTLLKAIGLYCEQKLKLRVAYVSADPYRASRMDGYLLHFFLGLRLSRDELPSQEQLEGTLERHVRLVQSTYASAFPSLRNIDVLLLDAMEKVDTVVLRAMDAVARRQHERPAEAFGGLRVFAAADFWGMPVHPTSDTGGYLFQLENWQELFPRQELLRESHIQSTALTGLVEKAYFGTLRTADLAELEAHASEASAAAADHTTTAPMTSGAAQQDVMTTNAAALYTAAPRFPKQRFVRLLPTRYRQLRQSEMGHFTTLLLNLSCRPLAFGLVGPLSIDVGSRVHLLFAARATTASGDGDEGTATNKTNTSEEMPQLSSSSAAAAALVPAGAVGQVRALREHSITVYFADVQRTLDIPRMRITCYHPSYPEITCELRQFPLFPRAQLSPANLCSYANCFHVRLDGRRMVDTNDLGNILARMRSFGDFTLRHTADYLQHDGMVHEPTRIYYHQLMQRPLTDAREYWCRNCKAFVPTADFFAHWAQCVKTVRWCSECDTTVPLELLAPHQEKHQIVLCLDCGRAVEWRGWEAHRLSCPAMMREVSPDNAFLPLRTRQLALELGLDKRDLHTMRSFGRSMLPKSRRSV